MVRAGGPSTPLPSSRKTGDVAGRVILLHRYRRRRRRSFGSKSQRTPPQQGGSHQNDEAAKPELAHATPKPRLVAAPQAPFGSALFIMGSNDLTLTAACRVFQRAGRPLPSGFG